MQLPTSWALPARFTTYSSRPPPGILSMAMPEAATSPCAPRRVRSSSSSTLSATSALSFSTTGTTTRPLRPPQFLLFQDTSSVVFPGSPFHGSLQQPWGLLVLLWRITLHSQPTPTVCPSQMLTLVWSCPMPRSQCWDRVVLLVRCF